MSKKPFVSAIIVAAGNSTRMSCGISKQLIPLLGKPAISYTFKAFENAQSISEVIVVCREADEAELRAIVSDYEITKVKAFVYGGSERSESVRNGISRASCCATHFAIHDGARALITSVDIDKVVSEAFVCSAATLGTFVTDTIKVVDEKGVITSTPDRSTLMAVQTPQVFERRLYLDALKDAKGKGFTDDCAMLEYAGIFPKVIVGDSTNMKLTTPSDISLAESILKKRQEQNL